MNIVVIMLDSLRPDFLGCGGNRICRTPYIDEIAAEGIFFENAYAEYPVTIPSRTALVSGNYTFTNRPWSPLRGYDLHIAEVLHDAGFRTAAFSDTPFRQAANMHRGFETFEWIPEGKCHAPVRDAEMEISPWAFPPWAEERELKFWPNTYKNRMFALEQYGKACPELLFDRAIDWIEQNAGNNFFLWIDSFEPHEPWAPVPPYNTMYQQEWERYIPFPIGPSCEWMTEADRRHVVANYMGEATHIDLMVGNVAAALEKAGIAGDTAIFIISDHGEPLCEHGTIRKYGCPIYDELAKMVFIAKIPGVTPLGAKCPAPVQNVDFAPTLASLLNLSLPVPTGEAGRSSQGYDGVDLVPLLRGERDGPRRDVFIGAFGLHAGIRRGPWKFIDNQGKQANELFNLTHDPGEKENLIEREAALASELHREVGEFRAQWAVALAWRDRPAED